jgi:hypothetical protein
MLEFFECLKEELLVKFLGKYHAETLNITRQSELCRLNYLHLYPIYCFAKNKCDPHATDLFFALIYARQQIQLGTQEPIKCDPNGKFDVNAELFLPNAKPQYGDIFPVDACEGVPECTEIHKRVKRVLEEQSFE